jgi:hypothetical protein
MSDRFIQDFRPVYGDNASDFDLALPKKPTSLSTLPKRLIIDGKPFPLSNESEEAKYIYKVIISAMSSEWYENCNQFSRRSNNGQLKFFLLWLNLQVINHENRYTILKDFESWRVNEKKVKPQSTGLGVILNILNQGNNTDHDEDEAFQYVSLLLKNTEISLSDERQQETLTSYFSSMPWIREVLGDKDYLKLESPKILINSFSITVATTLLCILEAKQLARELIDYQSQIFETNLKLQTNINHKYCQDLLLKMGTWTSDLQPNDSLTELMILDFVPNDRLDDVLIRLQKSRERGSFSYKNRKLRRYVFTEPCIFSPKNMSSPSLVEQFLCAWLCAWQIVQPFDIRKLKRNNFVINKNEQGKPVTIQCIYYKGRSQRNYEPPMLNAQQIEAKALIAYLNQLPMQDSNLFPDNINGSRRLGFSANSVPGRILRMFQSSKLQSVIKQNIEQREASFLFLKAYSALSGDHHNAIPFETWRSRQKKNGLVTSVKEYRCDVKNPMPMLHFGLNSIKNSSVHARTDLYREGDLVNQNSHTSLTEKISYLNDNNKDWVNQNGRITRLVMNDIENYVYKPNIEAAKLKAYELTLRTRVIDAVSSEVSDLDSVKINYFGRVEKMNSSIDQSDGDFDDIIVLNTEETVVTMLHYIEEAKRQYSTLINHALDFFERSVLPTVEWMEYLLTQGALTEKVVYQGKATYDQIKNQLPQLFINELRGAVGA